MSHYAICMLPLSIGKALQTHVLPSEMIHVGYVHTHATWARSTKRSVGSDRRSDVASRITLSSRLRTIK